MRIGIDSVAVNPFIPIVLLWIGAFIRDLYPETGKQQDTPRRN